MPLAVAAALGARPTLALAAPDVGVSVLGVEASDGAPDALAAALTDALRQRVSSTKGFRLVAGRDLVEVKLVFSCPDEAPSCMAQAGKSLGAGKLIFGSIKKSLADNFVVTLKLLDTTRGIIDTLVAEQITKAQTAGTALRGPVQKWFATLTGQGGAGTVRVRSDVIGATVAVDGTPWGVIGAEDFKIDGVTPGKHELSVSKPGYQVVRKDVTVTSGEIARVDVNLPRTAGSLPPALVPTSGSGTSIKGPVGETARNDEPGSHSVLRTTTWIVLGAGLVGVGLGVKYGLDIQKINKDLDQYRRFPCRTGDGMCDISQNPAPTLTEDEKLYVQRKKDDGRRLERYQYVSYGVGAALVMAGGYLFYRAYLRDDGERRVATGPISLAPVFGPDQTGLAASITF